MSQTKQIACLSVFFLAWLCWLARHARACEQWETEWECWLAPECAWNSTQQCYLPPRTCENRTTPWMCEQGVHCWWNGQGCDTLVSWDDPAYTTCRQTHIQQGPLHLSLMACLNHTWCAWDPQRRWCVPDPWVMCPGLGDSTCERHTGCWWNETRCQPLNAWGLPEALVKPELRRAQTTRLFCDAGAFWEGQDQSWTRCQALSPVCDYTSEPNTTYPCDAAWDRCALEMNALVSVQAETCNTLPGCVLSPYSTLEGHNCLSRTHHEQRVTGAMIWLLTALGCALLTVLMLVFNILLVWYDCCGIGQDFKLYHKPQNKKV